jgi:hypothetical protein
VSRNRIAAKVRTNPDYQALTRHLDGLGIRWAVCAPESKGHPYLLISDADGGTFRHSIACSPRGYINVPARIAQLNRALRQRGLI